MSSPLFNKFRDVVFDAGSHLHLGDGQRARLLDHVDVILGTVERPDHHEDDPLRGRERFFRQDVPELGRWLRALGRSVTWPDGHVTHDDPLRVLTAAA